MNFSSNFAIKKTEDEKQVYLQAPQDVFVLSKDQVPVQGCYGVRHGRLLDLFSDQIIRIWIFRLDRKTTEDFCRDVAVSDVADDERLEVSDHLEGFVGIVASLVVESGGRTAGRNPEPEVRSS